MRPELDDKILAGWNGLMISAFALGGAVLRRGALRGSGAARGGVPGHAHVQRRNRGT